MDDIVEREGWFMTKRNWMFLFYFLTYVLFFAVWGRAYGLKDLLKPVRLPLLLVLIPMILLVAVSYVTHLTEEGNGDYKMSVSSSVYFTSVLFMVLMSSLKFLEPGPGGEAERVSPPVTGGAESILPGCPQSSNTVDFLSCESSSDSSLRSENGLDTSLDSYGSTPYSQEVGRLKPLDSKTFRGLYKVVLDTLTRLLDERVVSFPKGAIKFRQDGKYITKSKCPAVSVSRNGDFTPGIDPDDISGSLCMLVNLHYRRIFDEYCKSLPTDGKVDENSRPVVPGNILKGIFNPEGFNIVEEGEYFEDYLWMRYLFLRCEEGLSYMAKVDHDDSYLAECLELGWVFDKMMRLEASRRKLDRLRRARSIFKKLRIAYKSNITQFENYRAYVANGGSELLQKMTKYLAVLKDVFSSIESLYDEKNGTFDEFCEYFDDAGNSKEKFVRLLFLLSEISWAYTPVLKAANISGPLRETNRVQVEYHHSVVASLCIVLNGYLNAIYESKDCNTSASEKTPDFSFSELFSRLYNFVPRKKAPPARERIRNIISLIMKSVQTLEAELDLCIQYTDPFHPYYHGIVSQQGESKKTE